MLKRILGVAALCLLAPAASAQDPAPAKAAPRVTAMYTTWDDYYFYAGFQVSDPHVFSANHTPISQPQQDDDVEVFFETDNARAAARTSRTFQMAVSAGNGAYFSIGDGTKVPKAKVVYTYKYAAAVQGPLNKPNETDIGYSVELAIPWQELGQAGPPRDGTTWGFNVISRDRDAADVPADRFFSLSPLVQSAADVQDPSKWSHITFTTGDAASEAADQVISPHTTEGRFPSIDGPVLSGEFPSSARLAFGTASIAAPAPTVAEEPNTTQSPFGALPPAQAAPPVAAVPAAPVIPIPPLPAQAAPSLYPDRLELPHGGGFIRVVPGGSQSKPNLPTAAPPQQVASGGPYTNPLTLKVPEKYQKAFPDDQAGEGVAPPLGPATPPKLVMATYRLDYNGDGRKAPAQNVWDAQGGSLLVDQPINGAGPWFSALRPLWHRQQLSDMRRAGIEVALVDAKAGDPLLGQELDALVEALKEMKAAGEDYPLVGEAPAGPLTTPTLLHHIPAEFRAGRGTEEARSRGTVPLRGTAGARATIQAYQAAWQRAIGAAPDSIIVDSWNDFTDGTEVAASRQYGERYADDTRIQTIAFNGNRQWHAKYLTESVPRTVLPKTLYQIPVRIENAGTLPWRAGEGYSLCARWYTPDGRLVDDSAPRIPVGHDVLPGQSVTLSLGVVARNGYGDNLDAGDYILVIDMVVGQYKWFSFAGDSPLQVPVHVAAAGDITVGARATFLGTTTPTAGQSGGTYRAEVDVRNDGLLPWPENKYTLGCKIEQIADDGSATTVAQVKGQPLSPVSVVPGEAVRPIPHLPLNDAQGRPLAPGEYRLRWFVQDGAGSPLLGGYDEMIRVVPAAPGVSFVLSDIPREMGTGQEVTARLAVQNIGGRPWAKAGQRIGYHWYYLDGTEAQWDGGLQSPFTKDVPQGRADGDIVAHVRAPAQPGRYSLVWDVQEADGTWASATPASAGTDILQALVTVTGKGNAVPVDLGKQFNASTADFDGQGHGLPDEMLPPDGTAEASPAALAATLGTAASSPLYPDGYYASHADHSVPFLYGSAAKRNNAITCQGQTISLPGGNYRAIHLLAAATGGQPVSAAFGVGDVSQAIIIANWTAAPAGAAGFRSPSVTGEEGDTATPATLGDYVLKADTSQRIDRLTLPNAPAVKIVAITLEK